jgi:oxygen-independent coproporphyrinogen-3 oxidase
MRLYIHWPFCVSRCGYCDFNSRVADRRVMRDYRKALVREVKIWSSLLCGGGSGLQSLYLGGGTPSTLSGDEASALLQEVAGSFSLPSGAEVTIEVNPASWTNRDFARAKAGGFNRFSIGVQSLDDRVLRLLGRPHGSIQAREAVCRAMEIGGAAVSVDLLYGLPLGGCESLQNTVNEVLSWRPQHISTYALTLEEKVPLRKRLAEEGLVMPEEDEVAEQYFLIQERLEGAGYLHYEISNYCLPGYQSRHNLAYWRREDYLGVGAGAHSLLGKCRFHNTPSLLGYMSRIGQGCLAVEGCEFLDHKEEQEEEIMLGLRTREGIPETLLEGARVDLDGMERLGLLKRRAGKVALTPKGMVLCNAVLVELIP